MSDRHAQGLDVSAVDVDSGESRDDGDQGVTPESSDDGQPAFGLDSDAAGLSDDGDTAGGVESNTPAGRRFDPDTAVQHGYLGDVDELGGSVGLLEEGVTYTLPLFALEGVVLLPGASLPLILHSIPDILKLERALRAPAGGPTARLVAVTHVHRHQMAMCLVCCSAEVRSIRRDPQLNDPADNNPRGGEAAAGPGQGDMPQPGGGVRGGPGAVPVMGGTDPRVRGAGSSVVAVVARGRQRLLLDPASLADTYRVRCRVLSEGLADPPPRQISSGFGFWAPWAAGPFDAPALAALAQQHCSAVLPQIACKVNLNRGQHNPAAVRQYSYWLAANLPLSDEQRQELLEKRDTAERLRLLLSWLGRLGRLTCKDCGQPVTQCSSALLMSSEGAGGAFVNAHGYVHDIATFRAVQGLAYVGRPETAHCWFPGYAWTIAVCANCSEHMGWRYTATSPDLQPPVFWGLRRASIVCPDLYGNIRAREDEEPGAAGRGARGRRVWGRDWGRAAEGSTSSSDEQEEYEQVYDEDTESDSEREEEEDGEEESEEDGEREEGGGGRGRHG